MYEYICGEYTVSPTVCVLDTLHLLNKISHLQYARRVHTRVKVNPDATKTRLQGISKNTKATN